MKYIIDKSIITSLANDGCAKNAVNIMDRKWKATFKKKYANNVCSCGSNLNYIDCCGKEEYEYIEERLGITIPHGDKAPLISHMQAGEYAEIRKIEELSHYFRIGTNLKKDENGQASNKTKEVLNNFIYDREKLEICFNKSNVDELKHLINERKINSKNFIISSTNCEDDEDIILPNRLKEIIIDGDYDYLYQLKFDVNEDFFSSLFLNDSIKEKYDFSRIVFRKHIPDFIKIIRKNDKDYDNYNILDKDMKIKKSGNEKIKLMIVDIKNAEFSNKFFIELGLYMLAFNCFIHNNKELYENFELVSEACIYPQQENELESERDYRIKTIGFSSMEIWKMQFNTVREELVSIFEKKLPDLINIIESGKKDEYNKIKIGPMCMTCDYYGGQNSTELREYIEKQNVDNSDFGYQNVEEYLKDPQNNFCRYCTINKNNINIIPNLNVGEKNVLLNNGVNNLDELSNFIESEDPILDQNKTLKSNSKIIKESIDIRKNNEEYRIINERTINLPKFSNLKIFIDIQTSSKDETLCFSYLMIYYNNDGLGNITQIKLEDDECSLSLIDKYTYNQDLREFLEFLFKINEKLKGYEGIQDRFGNKLTYSVIYWGSSSYNHLRKLFLEVFDYIKNDGDGIEKIYTGIASYLLNGKKRKIRELKERFYTLFAPEDEIQDYRLVEKSPFFDMKKAVNDLMVVNANINLTLKQATKAITGYETIFQYHKPDTDSFNGYAFGRLWVSGQVDSDARDKFKDKIKDIIKKRLKAMVYIYNALSQKKLLYGVAPNIIPLSRENYFGNFNMGNDLYLYHKLNDAHDIVETEVIHNEEVYKKSVLGKSIYLNNLVSGTEKESLLKKYGYNVNDNTLEVYTTKEYCKEANYDENSMFLTIYPVNKSEYIFQKFVDNPNYKGVIYYDSNKYKLSDHKNWFWSKSKPYKNVVEIKIEKFLRFENKVIIRIPLLTQDLIRILEDNYGFDFSKDVIVENFHTDIWGNLLKKTLEKVKENDLSKKILEKFINEQVNILEKDFIVDILKNYYSNSIPLDDSQYEAICNILNYRLTLLWGPPGTGKTHTLVHLIIVYYDLYVKNRNEDRNILIMCNNYDAFDNIIKKICDIQILDYSDIEIVRIKSRDRVSKPLEFKKINYVEVTSVNEVKELIKAKRNQKSKLRIVVTTPNQMAKIFTDKKLSSYSSFKFDLVMIDEASQMDVGHFTPALLKIKEETQLVLAGDDLQLPPISKVKIKNSDVNYYSSIFSYYDSEFGTNNTNMKKSLLCNRRSNSIIVEYSKSTFGYDEGYRSEENKDGRIAFEKPLEKNNLYDTILDPNKVMCLVNYKDGNSNQMNAFEAQQIVNIIKRIWELGVYRYNTESKYEILEFFDKCIGVVVPHRAQRTEIQLQLIRYFVDEICIHEQEKIDKDVLQQKIISCVDTVEKYQGQEREIMLCSYVLGDTDIISEEEEFIYSPNRLNVMISRARFKAIVLASNELMMNISNSIDIIEIQKSLKNLISYCDRIYNIGDINEWYNREGILRYKS